MADFPAIYAIPELAVITSCGQNTLFYEVPTNGNVNFNTGAVWPAVNRALFIPFWVEQPCLAQKMAVNVTATAAGNLDLGIYDEKGTLLVSIGTTAIGGVGLQVVDITDTELDPGTYFMAMACSTVTTAAFARVATGSVPLYQVAGIQQMATAMPLPATATFANPAVVYCPHIAIACVPTI